MSELFSTEQYEDFRAVLLKVSTQLNYSIEQHNNLVDFLGNVDLDTGLYIIEILMDFFTAGVEYSEKVD